MECTKLNMRGKNSWADIKKDTNTFILFGGDGEGYICSEQDVKFWAKETQVTAKEVIFLVPKHSSLLHMNESNVCQPAEMRILKFAWV